MLCRYPRNYALVDLTVASRLHRLFLADLGFDAVDVHARVVAFVVANISAPLDGLRCRLANVAATAGLDRPSGNIPLGIPEPVQGQLPEGPV